MSLAKRKVEANQIFNCRDLKPFIDSIVQVMPFKGVSGSRFYNCEYDGVQFLTKMCFYHKSAPETYNRTSHKTVPSVDAEIQILRKFRDRITNKGVSPCILELIYDKICTGVSRFIPRRPACDDLQMSEYKDTPANDVNRMMCSFKDLIDNGLAHDKCAFLVLERCDMSLDEYLKRNLGSAISIAVFKSLLFQIVYTMYAISRIYPKFRHYDLHTENIMLKFDTSYKFKANDLKYLVFNVRNGNTTVTYTVPYFGIIVKLIDFGFSMLPEEGILSAGIDDKKFMYHRADNDLLLLFHWINYTVMQSGSDKNGAIGRILNALEPNQAYITYYAEGIRRIADKIPTYKDMINNKVWNEYIRGTATRMQVYGEYTLE